METFLHEWEPINHALIQFSHSAAYLYPCSLAEPAQKNLHEMQVATTAYPTPLCTTLTNTYFLAYQILAPLEPVGPERHSRTSLLLHLMWAALWGWADVAADAVTGNRLVIPTVVPPEGQSETTATYAARLPPLPRDVSQGNEISWGSAADKNLWEETLRATRTAWLRESQGLPRCESVETIEAAVGNGDVRIGLAYSIHVSVVIAQHFHYMQRLFAAVFLRLDKAIGGVSQLCTAMMGEVLQHNSDWVKHTLQEAIGLLIRSEEADSEGSSGLLFPFGGDIVGSVPFASAERISQVLREVDLAAMHLLLRMVEVAAVRHLQEWVLETTILSCREHGRHVAAVTLGTLLQSTEEDTLLGQAPHTTQVVQAVQALREALHHYIRFRTQLLVINTGTPNFLEKATPAGRKRFFEGLLAFLSGFSSSEDGLLLRVVEIWGVPLWLQYCAAVPAPPPAEASPGTGSAQTTVLTHVMGALRVDRGTPSVLVGSSTVRSFGEAHSQATSVCGEGERRAWLRRALRGGLVPLDTFLGEDEEDSVQRHLPTALPVDGLPTLLHLLTEEKVTRRRILTTFAAQIHKYFVGLLHEAVSGCTPPSPWVALLHEKRSQQHENRGTTVPPLPPIILEWCILSFRATLTAFRLDSDEVAEHLRRVRRTMPVERDEAGGEQGATVDDPDEPLTPGETALFVVCSGLHGFFTAWERSASMTLAHALHTHVMEEYKTCTRGVGPAAAAFEVIDTVLAMASLLSTKEGFIDYYKTLMAPRVLLLKSPKDLAVDAEVVTRMEISLGHAAAAPCQTLLRDLEHAMQREQPPPPSASTEAEEALMRPAVISAAATLLPFASSITRQNLLPRNGPSLQVWAGGPGMLLRRCRVLCEAWWRPHVAAVATVRDLQKLYENHGLLQERIVDAVMRFEWHNETHRPPGASYPGYGTSRMGENPPNEDSRSSIVSLSQSTSTVVQGLSTAISKTMQQSSTLLYGNIRLSGAFGNDDDEVDDERNFSDAYGGLLQMSHHHRMPLHQHNPTRTPSHQPRHTTTTVIRGNTAMGRSDAPPANSASPLHEARERPSPEKIAQRRFAWPLGCGQLTFLIHCLGDVVPVESHTNPPWLQVSAPPLVYIVLQLLSREAAVSNATGMTFDGLCRGMPLTVPRLVMVHLLRHLVRTGVVERLVHTESQQYVYTIPVSFGALGGQRVKIDLHTALKGIGAEVILGSGTARPREQTGRIVATPRFYRQKNETYETNYAEDVSLSAAVKGEDPEVDARQLAALATRTEVCVVQTMKAASATVAHASLYERVVAADVARFGDPSRVTPALLKECVGRLIEKGYLERVGRDDYVYMA